ncbi:uncharacterized protein LOC111442979 isoform X1 [Cucurbita moschata]|uniref:Uncharacterized protein LOC111442979 isoform X1 n=1 Tax=Cucurbita moschata TaxID=3662 RepID=A0A6J1F764_CUCMO|nr:uncharacterized protein LOC111442979 isoform X1 [Cucurbita moschata]
MTLPRDKFSRGFDGCLDAILASGLLDEDVSHAQLVNLSLPWIIAMARFCKYSHGAISPRRFLRPATEAVPYFEQGMCGRSCLMLLELLFQTEINRFHYTCSCGCAARLPWIIVKRGCSSNPKSLVSL